MAQIYAEGGESMIAGLKPYPRMKDSGVPWLGAVPEHGTARWVNYLCQSVSSVDYPQITQRERKA